MSAVVDFNGDHLLDIVVIDEDKGALLYFGQKDQTFSAGISISDSKIVPSALTTADLNNDKKIDIIAGQVRSPSSIFFNDDTGRHFKTRMVIQKARYMVLRLVILMKMEFLISLRYAQMLRIQYT